MKNFNRGALALLFLTLTLPAQAAIRILATTADWGALATELGGERVDVYVATSALQDVHRVDAKPSLVARARTADLVVANGAELEVGWLPVLLQEAGNARIQRGAPGYFEAAAYREDARNSIEPRPLARRHPSAGQSARAARSAEHRRRRKSAEREARGARPCGVGLLLGTRWRFRQTLGRGDRPMGEPRGAAQGRASRHHASRPGLSLSLARPERTCVDRAEARRAAQRRLSRAARYSIVGVATAPDPVERLQRSQGREMAVGADPRAGGRAAVLGRRDARRERISSDCSTTPSIVCWVAQP